jgi:hypothetical protein
MHLKKSKDHKTNNLSGCETRPDLLDICNNLYRAIFDIFKDAFVLVTVPGIVNILARAKENFAEWFY